MKMLQQYLDENKIEIGIDGNWKRMFIWASMCCCGDMVTRSPLHREKNHLK